jgi:hypothetical protein
VCAYSVPVWAVWTVIQCTPAHRPLHVVTLFTYWLFNLTLTRIFFRRIMSLAPIRPPAWTLMGISDPNTTDAHGHNGNGGSGGAGRAGGGGRFAIDSTAAEASGVDVDASGGVTGGAGGAYWRSFRPVGDYYSPRTLLIVSSLRYLMNGVLLLMLIGADSNNRNSSVWFSFVLQVSVGALLCSALLCSAHCTAAHCALRTALSF